MCVDLEFNSGNVSSATRRPRTEAQACDFQIPTTTLTRTSRLTSELARQLQVVALVTARCPWTLFKVARKWHAMGKMMGKPGFGKQSGTLKRVPDLRLCLERKTGFEPATLTLAR